MTHSKTHSIKDIQVAPDILAAIRTATGQDCLSTHVSPSILNPISLTIEKPLEIGHLYPNQGIYLGKYQPCNRQERSLCKTFNVFVAPEDLKKFSLKTIFGKKSLFTYNEAVSHLNTQKKWHGHYGIGYASDDVFYAALEEGSYQGQWVIPTLELLSGKDIRNKYTQSDNISNKCDIGAFQNTFTPKGSDNSRYTGTEYPENYWSCTALLNAIIKITEQSRMGNTSIPNDTHGFFHKNSSLSCRPVRLVEIKP